MKSERDVMEEEDVATERHPLEKKGGHHGEAVRGGNHKFLTASQMLLENENIDLIRSCIMAGLLYLSRHVLEAG